MMAGGRFSILTVCSGNICRSPLAEQLLRTGLSTFAEVELASAGTVGLVGHGMEQQSQQLSLRYGGTNPEQHVARFLTEQIIRESDLHFAMSREHRRAIVELVPRAMRTTFTIREFARLSAAVTDEQLISALRAYGAPASLKTNDGGVEENERIEATDPLVRLRALSGNPTPAPSQVTPTEESATPTGPLTIPNRFRIAVDVVASQRGLVTPPASPEDDDVIDPYKQTVSVYQQSADELVPAVQATLNFFARAVSLN